MTNLLLLLPLLLFTIVSVALAWRLFRRFGRKARSLAALVWAQLAAVPLILFAFGDSSPTGLATGAFVPWAMIVAAIIGTLVILSMETGLRD